MKRFQYWVGVCVLTLALSVAAVGQAQEGGARRGNAAGAAAEPEAPGKEKPAPVAAEVSVLRLVKFSGQLRGPKASGGQPRTEIVGATFALYAQQEGGAALWLETQNVEADAEGRYSVLLGAESSEGLPLEIFTSGEARWLGVQVQGEEEQPRVLLVSVPYALKAADADTLGGKPASAFVVAESTAEAAATPEAGAGSPDTGTTALAVDPGTVGDIVKYTVAPDTLGPATDFVETGGNVGIGTTIPTYKLTVDDPNFAGNDFMAQIRNRGGVASAGGLWVDTRWDVPENFILRLTTNSLSKEVMAVKGSGNVGIGTTSPAYKLTVDDPGFAGNDFMVQIRNRGGVGTAGGLWVDTRWDVAENYILRLTTNSLTKEVLAVKGSGNVGIGTVSPGAKLEIGGQVKITGGSPGAGKVLTSDAAGLASWATPTGGISGSGAATRVAFWDGATSLNSNGNLFWDNTNSRLGIGTATPGSALEVAGQVKITGGAPGAGKVLTSNAAGLATWETPSGGGWSLTGNVGTTAGTNFLGTTDNVALELKVNGARALRLEPNALSPNVIGGFSGNSVGSGLMGVTIAGGGEGGNVNSVTSLSASFATIGGGDGNTASEWASTVGGGEGNTASGFASTVGGGEGNTASHNEATVSGGMSNTASEQTATVGGGEGNMASGNSATVGGGLENTASGSGATVGGGTQNTASGNRATVGGGRDNTASGQYSFAAGQRAKALHDGTFVWADSTMADFSSTATNQFLIRAGGGLGINKNNPAAALDVNGTVKATAFMGDGSGLTGIGVSPGLSTRGLVYLAGCDSCSVLVDEDDQRTIYQNVIGAMTIAAVTCFSDNGTPAINLQRDDNSPANILNVDLNCSTSGATSTGFSGSENILNLNDRLDFVMVSAGMVTKRLTIVISATLN